MQRVEKFSRRAGSVLAEAALGLVLLCMLTLGAIKYGWLFRELHCVTSAAREGARCGAKAGATEADITNAVAAAMETMGSPNYTLTITPIPDIHAVEVTVSLSTDEPGIDIIPGFLPTPAALTGKTTMAVEEE